MKRNVVSALASGHSLSRFFMACFMAITAVFGAASSASAQVDWLVQIDDIGFDPVVALADIQYTLQVDNNGFGAAPATTVEVAIPADSQFISAAGGTINNCTAVPASGVGPAVITCDVPALASLGLASTVLTVQSVVAGAINVSAEVIDTGTVDINLVNNIEPETTTVLAGSDLAIDLTVPATAASGSVVDLDYVVTNNGPNIANSFQVIVPAPSGLVNIVAPAGCIFSGGNYTCTIAGPLAVGATVPLTFTGQVAVAAGSTITPSGSVVNSDPADAIASNNTDTDNITVTAGSDVFISKSRSPSGTLLVGDTVTFTLDAAYTGGVPSDLVVTDTLPANYGIVSVSAPGGWTCTIVSQTVECTLPGGTVTGADISLGGTITIETTVLSPGSATNTAVISSSGPIDSNLGNNTDTDGGATIAVPIVDLRANKSGPTPALNVIGQPYSYNISTSNIGNADFFGTINMVDTLPAGLTINSATLNGWTCLTIPATGPIDITCSRVYTAISPLAAGATTPSITLVSEFTAEGTLTNTLHVSSPDANIGDLNGPNNITTHVTTVTTGGNSADIRTVKTAAIDPIAAGETQTYTLEIINDGAQSSLDIDILDNLTNLINNNVGATGAGFISLSISQGVVANPISCSTASSGSRSRQLSCNIDVLPICIAGADCPVITVLVRPGGDLFSPVPAPDTRTNTFSAISQVTPDPDLGNNTASVDFDVTQVADMTVTKTANPDPVAAGQDLTYVVAAININNGLSVAENVSITDTLPDDMTVISISPSTGSCPTAPVIGSTTSSSTLICNLGSINNGAQQTVTVVLRPNFATLNTTITNAVTVATTTPETDPTNNAASVDVFVGPPDLDILVNKVDSIDPVIIGTDTVYTITVTNTGASAAENVVATDTMPATRLDYQSHVISGAGTCSAVPAVGSLGGTLTCSWPYLAAGDSETIEITSRGVASGSSQNDVSISSDEIVAGFDRLAANNQTSEITTVRLRTDIEVSSKVATPSAVELNDNFIFTAIVHVNTGMGLYEAEDVVFSDTLPAGMILTGTPFVVLPTDASNTVCTGSVGGSAFTCDLGTVSYDGTVEITIPVEVVSIAADGTTLTNTATIATSSFDIDPSNDSNSGPITIGSSSIAGTVFRDFQDDTAITAGDTFVNGILITLTGTSFDGKPISLTTTTDPSGNFIFPTIPQGTYTLTRGPVAEPWLTDGTNTPGTEGGTSTQPLIIGAISVPFNTDAVEYLFPLIPQARIGIAKDVVGGPTTHADGSFDTTFQLVVENFSLEALDNIVVTDPLQGAAPLFGTYQLLATPATDPLGYGEYTMLAPPTGTCGGIQAGFDGAGALTVASGFSLPIGGTCTLDISLRIQPTNPMPPILASGGRYENQATVTGEGSISGQTSATNPELTDISDDGTNPDPSGNGSGTDAGEGDPTPVIPLLSPAISLVKTADDSAVQSPAQPGDTVSYSFRIENTGDVNLTNVTLSDILPGIVITGSPIASMAPGEVVTLTGSYDLLLADIDAGEVPNTATVIGTDPYDTVVSDEDSALVPLVAGPGISLLKTADASAFQTPTLPGDIITYSFRVENTGNVTLTNVQVVDPLPVVIAGSPIASMAPGEVVTLTGPYAITQADILAGEVLNSATATGTPPTGPDVEDTSDTITPINQVAAIDLVKTVDAAAHAGGSAIGDIVNYSFTVTNTGNIPLTNVTVTDALVGVVMLGGPIPLLNPGEVDTDTFTASYVLQAADITAGEVVNNASVTGFYGPGNGLTVDDDGVAILPVGPLDNLTGITLTKTTPNPVVLRGSIVPYTITVTNDNSFTAGPLDLVDRLPPSFIYVDGSATLDAAPYTVTVNGAAITWPNITIPANGQTVITLQARVLNGANAGSHVNTASLIYPDTGLPVLEDETATVRIMPEAVFDCVDVIGKVFDDVNGNGYQDSAENSQPAGAITDQVYHGGKGKPEIAPLPLGEPGIPGVRLVTVDGLIITTDEFGRFTVPCAMLPAGGGSNFILKLDPRSLPSGFAVTTENPRVVRVTPGTMTELNFGATLGRIARVEVNAAGFAADGTPSAALSAGISQLAQSLVGQPVQVVIVYHVGAQASAAEVTQARSQMQIVERDLQEAWRGVGRGRLSIETQIARIAQ